MIYLDTSYLVRLYFQDSGFPEVQQLAASDSVACAWHGQAELLGAFHRKFREKVMDAAAYAALLDQYEEDQRQGAVQWLPQGQPALNRLTSVYRALPNSVFLRAADALHLAVAAESGFKEVYSHDSHMLAAASHFGIKGLQVF